LQNNDNVEKSDIKVRRAKMVEMLIIVTGMTQKSAEE
jgi:hypothetical protein